MPAQARKFLGDVASLSENRNLSGKSLFVEIQFGRCDQFAHSALQAFVIFPDDLVGSSRHVGEVLLSDVALSEQVGGDNLAFICPHNNKGVDGFIGEFEYFRFDLFGEAFGAGRAANARKLQQAGEVHGDIHVDLVGPDDVKLFDIPFKDGHINLRRCFGRRSRHSHGELDASPIEAGPKTTVNLDFQVRPQIRQANNGLEISTVDRADFDGVPCAGDFPALGSETCH